MSLPPSACPRFLGYRYCLVVGHASLRLSSGLSLRRSAGCKAPCGTASFRQKVPEAKKCLGVGVSSWGLHSCMCLSLVTASTEDLPGVRAIVQTSEAGSL